MTLDQIFARFGVQSNLTLVILTGALLLARLLPVIFFSPVIGGDLVTNEVKIGVGLTMAIVIFPAVEPQMTTLPIQTFPYIGLLVKEVFIGMALSFVLSMVFEAAQLAGALMDMFSGANMAQMMVPHIQQNVTLYSSLHVQLAIVLFLTLDGHHLVLNAVAESFLSLPVDRFPTFSQGVWPFFELILRVFGDMLRIGLTIAAPVLVATFLTDLALGLVNRVAPQIQVFFISMSAKPVITALVVIVSIRLILDRIHLDFADMLRRFTAALRLLT